MSVGKSTLFALVGLAFVLAIAIGTLAASGEVLHLLSPARHFDIYYVLHKQLVVASLLAVSILWLLPPHPWAKALVEEADRGPAQAAGEAEGDDSSNVISLADYQGRGPPLRRRGTGGRRMR